MAVNPNIDLARGPDLGASIESSVATDQTKSEQLQASAEKKAGNIERGHEKERELPGPEADREQGRETEIPANVRNQVAALQLDKHQPGADGPGQGQGQDPHKDPFNRLRMHAETSCALRGHPNPQEASLDELLENLDQPVDQARAAGAQIGADVLTNFFGGDIAGGQSVDQNSLWDGGMQIAGLEQQRRDQEIMMG